MKNIIRNALVTILVTAGMLNFAFSQNDIVKYKDTIVKVEAIAFPDKDLRVIDPVGKIWYLNFSDVRKV